MESNRGAEPATFEPPASSATQTTDQERRSAPSLWCLRSFDAVEAEVTRGPGTALVLIDDEDDEGMMAEIDATFRRKLAAIRRLPKGDRHAARRAAMDERSMALLALRQKREATRQFRVFLSRLHAPKLEK